MKIYIVKISGNFSLIINHKEFIAYRFNKYFMHLFPNVELALIK